MERHYQVVNRLNLETMEWEYAPRNVTVERGRVQVEKKQRCVCGAGDTSTCHLAGYGHGNLCESCHAVGAPVVR